MIQSDHLRKSALALVLLSLLSAWCYACLWAGNVDDPSAGPEPPARLNLILLLADDLRFDALGAAGNGVVWTPNLDRLASDGVRFANAFCTTSICPTSRASFLTGQYGSRHLIEDFATPLTARQLEASWPGVLGRAGYRTAFVGKWGLGGPLPREWFDSWHGFAGQGRYLTDQDGKAQPSDEPALGYFTPGHGKHLTSALGDAAVRFLEDQSPSQPFALQLSFKAPHAQDNAPNAYPFDKRFADLFAATEVPRPASATETAFAALPEMLRLSEGRVRWAQRLGDLTSFQSSVKSYYRLIAGIDQVVGRIRRVLARRKLADRTVVVVSSDNGLLLGEHGLTGKWLMFEESIRIPLVIFDPRLSRDLKGAVVTEPVLNIDVAPTLLDLVGMEVPQAMQGRSLRPLLTGQGESWRTDWYYEHRYEHPRIPRVEGVRTADWKYVVYRSGADEVEQLFNLRQDPLEMEDLASDGGAAPVLQRMRERLDELRLQAGEGKDPSQAPPSRPRPSSRAAAR